jgi:6-phosphofructokinase 1
MTLNRVGILTGGGDCSGLNAVIRAITRAAIIQYNSTVIGIEDGFDGLIFGQYQELSIQNTRDILPLGGTIIGTTNIRKSF